MRRSGVSAALMERQDRAAEREGIEEGENWVGTGPARISIARAEAEAVVRS
jgi:hypothetical protein